MACTKFEYVKDYESDPPLLKSTWIVVRIDGKGFHKFTKQHNFEKPNDLTALHLMNYAATQVMDEIMDITMAYGHSDEYSFLFKKSTSYFCRRPYKLASTLSSLFTSHYVLGWPKHFPNTPLQQPPCFDARAVTYPTSDILKDYFAWRQADCHINNLHNTAFWALILQKNMSEREATQRLDKTNAAYKNELLFSEFGINYNSIDPVFRKGTVLTKKKTLVEKECQIPKDFPDPKFPILRREGDFVYQKILRPRLQVFSAHVDVIGKDFWSIHEDVISE